MTLAISPAGESGPLLRNTESTKAVLPPPENGRRKNSGITSDGMLRRLVTGISSEASRSNTPDTRHNSTAVSSPIREGSTLTQAFSPPRAPCKKGVKYRGCASTELLAK